MINCELSAQQSGAAVRLLVLRRTALGVHVRRIGKQPFDSVSQCAAGTRRSAENHAERQLLHTANSHARPVAEVRVDLYGVMDR